jgi:hypothetical protein
MTTNFSIGYIRHNPEVFAQCLGLSLAELEPPFEVLSTSNKESPARNYNQMIKECKSNYLILTHEDVSFSSDLLDNILVTIALLPENWGVLGMVGRTRSGLWQWSQANQIFEVDTLDCCFIVIKPGKILFDEKNFNEYHLYVEDYCAQANRVHGLTNWTIMMGSAEAMGNFTRSEQSAFMQHHSATVSQRGFCWGRYGEFRRKLEGKWPGIQTT